MSDPSEAHNQCRRHCPQCFDQFDDVGSRRRSNIAFGPWDYGSPSHFSRFSFSVDFAIFLSYVSSLSCRLCGFLRQQRRTHQPTVFAVDAVKTQSQITAKQTDVSPRDDATPHDKRNGVNRGVRRKKRRKKTFTVRGQLYEHPSFNFFLFR